MICRSKQPAFEQLSTTVSQQFAIEPIENPSPHSSLFSESTVIDPTSSDSESLFMPGMAAEASPKYTPSATEKPDALLRGSSDLASKEALPRTDNDLERYSIDWYDDELPDNKRARHKRQFLWECIGADQDKVLRKDVLKEVKSLVNKEFAGSNSINDKGQHRKMAQAIKTLDKEFQDKILQRRRCCEKRFRERIWKSLLHGCRPAQPKSRKKDSDVVYVDGITATGPHRKFSVQAASSSVSATLPMDRIAKSNGPQDQCQVADNDSESTGDAQYCSSQVATLEPLHHRNLLQNDRDPRKNKGVITGGTDSLLKKANEKYLVEKPALPENNTDETHCSHSPRNETIDQPATNRQRLARPVTLKIGNKDPKILKRPLRELESSENQKHSNEATKKQMVSWGVALPAMGNGDVSISADSHGTRISDPESSESPDIPSVLQFLDEVPVPVIEAQKEVPIAPIATMGSDLNRNFYSGFTPNKMQPHGEVRLGCIRKGEYCPIPRQPGATCDQEIEDILDRFRSNNDAIFTGMEVTLRETCQVDGLDIRNVTLPPKGPYPQLAEFFDQTRLKEQSLTGLDIVIEPIGLQSFYRPSLSMDGMGGPRGSPYSTT